MRRGGAPYVQTAVHQYVHDSCTTVGIYTDLLVQRTLMNLIYTRSPAQIAPILEVEHLIVIDKKSTALKDLQGEIWELGYNNGELKAELFPETVECLQQWHQQGITLSVYSSGSIHAQKLLYRYTSEGNLETLFSHWFDTHIGNKKNEKSYTTIASAMECKPRNILFVSDNREECDAAKDAGPHP